MNNFIRLGAPRKELIPYECGLEGIFIGNGYDLPVKGGREFLNVHDREQLHLAIAEHLVLNRKVLDKNEIRFIRRTMGLTQKQLGECLAVSDQTVASWERGLGPLNGAADRMLRIMLLVNRLAPDDFKQAVAELNVRVEQMSDGRHAPANFDHAVNDDGPRWFERKKEAA